MSNLYIADPADREPRALTRYPEGTIGGAFWSRDGQRIYYPGAGDLWQVGIAGTGPAPVWTTPAPESAMAPSPDGTRVAFVRGGNQLWVRSLTEGSEVRLASDARSVGNPTWSPDGERLS